MEPGLVGLEDLADNVETLQMLHELVQDGPQVLPVPPSDMTAFQ